MSELIHTDALKDKSLWLAVLAPVLVMAGKVFGLELSTDMVMTVVGPIVAFILASKFKQAHVAAAVAKTAPELESLKTQLESLMSASEVKADESVK
jgi:hypothetical protein